jgi:23S rRNA pseudouridine2605 synthase
LQQTFDKRAIREARQPRREYAEDGPIPNPLEQTYDKRFVQKPRGPGGGGRKGGAGGDGQPDPMKTSLGYIGADAFVRKFNSGGGGGGGGGGGRGGRRRGGR